MHYWETRVDVGECGRSDLGIHRNTDTNALSCRRTSSVAESVSSSSKERENQALSQLKATLITFMIGYDVVYGVQISYSFKSDYGPKTFFALIFVSHGVLRVPECLNPFLYYFASDNIKKEAQLHKAIQFCCRAGSYRCCYHF